MRYEELTQEEYKAKLAEVADLAVNYAKTGRGYFSMRDAFNELAEASDSNRGIDHECSIGRRKILVGAVCIQCIMPLNREELSQVERELISIAEDFSSRRGMHR